MTESYTAAEFLKGLHKERKSKPPILRTDKYKSNLERRYAEYLEKHKLAGEIANWAYEPKKFPIIVNGNKIVYIPDFKVTYNNGKIEWHETKFVHYRDKNGKMVISERAKVGLLKLRIAADRYLEHDWYLVEWLEKRWCRTQQGKVK